MLHSETQAASQSVHSPPLQSITDGLREISSIVPAEVEFASSLLFDIFSPAFPAFDSCVSPALLRLNRIGGAWSRIGRPLACRTASASNQRAA